MTSEDGSFLSRWSRRKDQARRGYEEPPAPDVAAPVPPAAPLSPAPGPDDAGSALVAPQAAASTAAAELRQPLPTLQDVAALTRDSDFSRFVAPGVDDGVKQAAMKKLFSDPHFNVMDGLDIYIDDYSRPDPIPIAMLRSMAQSKALRLFDDDEPEPAAPPAADATTPTTAAPEPEPTHDDDADLQLQPDHAAGRAGLGAGAGA